MADKPKKKLNPKQEKFALEYVVDLNATQAAVRAGYSPRTAGKIGYQLLQILEIQKQIQQEQAALARRTEVSAEAVIEEYRRIAFSNIQDLATWDSSGVEFKPSDALSREDAAAIAEVSSVTTEGRESTRTVLRVKQHDKIRALEALSKHLGLFIERHEVTGADGAPLVSEIDVSKLNRRQLKALAEIVKSGSGPAGGSDAGGASPDGR